MCTYTYIHTGRIINIGSVVDMIPQAAPTYAYDSSKPAVHSLTQKLSHAYMQTYINT